MNDKIWMIALLAALGSPAQAATVRYVHTDALGSVVAKTDENAVVLERREYEPYGRQLAPANLQDGPGYTGHVQDAATQLTYMQQRYYDPAIGRFLSVDPVTADAANGGNFNRYWYANNSPYKYFDPDGRYVCTLGPTDCERVDTAIATIRNSAENLPESERPIVARISEFYGDPWEDNGVTIGPELNEEYGGGTLTHNGKTKITVDLAAFPENADLAATLGHEGNHGVDQKRFGMPTDEPSERAGERRAATAEALVYKGLGTDSPRGTWTNSGGLNAGAIHKQAEQSTYLWCQDNPACE